MPQINKQVSFGNLLTIGSIILAAGVGWGTIGREVETQTLRIEKLELLAERVQALETAQAVTTTKLTAIQHGIGELKQAQGETNSLIRTLLQNQR
jgi:hypothetical protein